MDELDIFMELETRDLDILKEIVEISADRDLLVQRVESEAAEIQQLGENSDEALQRLELLFEELLS